MRLYGALFNQVTQFTLHLKTYSFRRRLTNRGRSPDTSNWNLSHAYSTSWLMSNANSTRQQYSATFSAFSRSRIERFPAKVVRLLHSY